LTINPFFVVLTIKSLYFFKAIFIKYGYIEREPFDFNNLRIIVIFIPHRLQSIFWMFAWAASFSTAMALLKSLGSLPIATVIFVRFALSLVFIAPLLLSQGRDKPLKSTKMRLHGLNAIFRVIAIWATYYAYSRLPMGLAASIGYTGPMMAIVLAMILLREKVGWRKWVAVIIGYAGVLVMVQPEQAHVNIAVFVALLANLCSSLAKVTTKEITKTDTVPQVIFYGNLGALLISCVFAGYYWEMPSEGEWPMLIAIGFAGSLSQFSYVKALHAGNVSLVAPFEYLRLLFAIPVGMLFFEETLTEHHMLGCSIIVGCSVYLTWREIQRNQHNAKLSLPQKPEQKSCK